MGNRQAAEKYWFEQVLEPMLPGGFNLDIYKEWFGTLSDKAFRDLMTKVQSGELILPFYYSNLTDERIKVHDLRKLCDAMGIKIFEKLIITDSTTGVKYKTPIEYMVLDVPLKRMKQHLVYGKSVSRHGKSSDAITGQAAGASQSSRLTLMEISILESWGARDSIEELIKVRGGDNVARAVARRDTIDTGSFSLKKMEELNTRPTATETLNAVLLAMHFENNA